MHLFGLINVFILEYVSPSTCLNLAIRLILTIIKELNIGIINFYLKAILDRTQN